MKVGDELKFMNKTIIFKSINFEEEKNYKLLKGNFEIIESGKRSLNFIRSSKYILERIPSGKINIVSFNGSGSEIIINSEIKSWGFSLLKYLFISILGDIILMVNPKSFF